MKKLILFLSLGGFVLNATAQTQTADVLQIYLNLTDALVSDDSKTASLEADKLEESIKRIEPAKLQPKEKKAFEKVKAAILESAGKMSSAKNIKDQRLALAALSEELWAVVKVAESVVGPVYYHYCPMKKAYWISREADIRNPYYGRQMLTCGKNSETRKK